MAKPANSFSLIFPDLNKEFIVIKFSSLDHGLSLNYTFTCHIISYSIINAADYFQSCELRLFSTNYSQCIPGIITKVITLATENIDTLGYEYEFTLQSPIYQLSLKQHNRVLVDKSITEIIRAIILPHGFLGDNIQFKFKQVYPIIPVWIQYEEDDLSNLMRLINKFGVFFYFTTDTICSKIIFSDNNGDLPRNKSSLAYYGELRDEALYEILPSYKLLPNSLIYSEYNPQSPLEPLILQSTNTTAISGYGVKHVHGEDFMGTDGKLFIQVAQEALDWQRELFYAITSRVDLRPGAIIAVDYYKTSYNSHYLVVNVEHFIDITGFYFGKQQHNNKGYYNKVCLIKATQPYRNAQTLLPKYTGPLLGVIDSNVDNIPDEYGRYRVKFNFDNAVDAASVPVLAGQIFASEKSDIGWHFPLMPGTEVVLMFLNGDINRPVIIGTLFKEQDLVTSNNPYDNVLFTNSNQLTLQDTPGEEKIIFTNHDGKNQLILDATPAAPKLSMCMAGDLQVEAAVINLDASNSSEQIAGNYIIETDKYILNSEQLEFAVQLDAKIAAEEEININVLNNTELNTDNSFNINSENIMLQFVDGKVLIQSEHDSIEIAAAEINLSIEDGGSLILEQSGAKIELSTNNISIESSNGINISAENINLGSVVKYSS